MNSENVYYCPQKLINRASPRERKRGQSVRIEQGGQGGGVTLCLCIKTLFCYNEGEGEDGGEKKSGPVKSE